LSTKYAEVAELADAVDSKCYASKVSSGSETLDFIGFLTTSFTDFF